MRQILELQRSVGNAATGALIASSRRVESSGSSVQPTVQRVFERGSGTGWGWPRWVDGGEALWTQLNTGFNIELLSLVAQMRAMKATHPGIAEQLTDTEQFVAKWDGRKQIFHQASDPVQDISAAELAGHIAAQVQDAKTAIDDAKNPPVPLKKEVPSPKQKKQPAGKTKATTDPPAKASEATIKPVAIESVAKPIRTPPSAKKAKATPKGPSPQAINAKEAERAKKAKELEERQRLNQEKKKAQEARVATVEKFGAALKSETERLRLDEKISNWPTVNVELDALVADAKAKAKGDASYQRWLRSVFETWTGVLAERRETNRVDRQGTLLQWRTWLQLTNYVIVDAAALGGAEHTSLVPEAGTEGPSGPGYDIHVTLDPSQVRMPTRDLNDQTVDELVDDLLSVGNVGLRIHATLETGLATTPHVYWRNDDLGQGVRYPWGSTKWAAAGGGKDKVSQVLEEYVARVIRPRAAMEHKRLTYKPYAWPTFDVISAPLLTKT